MNELRALIDAVKSKRCILFLGAGVHVPPPEDSQYKYPPDERPPLGSKLAEILDKKCGYSNLFPNEKNALDLQRVSLCFETEPYLGRNELVKELKLNLAGNKKASPALKMLAELPFPIIVTTNYDSLLESALRPKKDPVIFVYNPKPNGNTPDYDGDPTENRPLVFKMHGDLDKPESIVITDEDYITFVQRMSDKIKQQPIPETVLYRMGRWPTLFVGYSMHDYNLRLLFRTLRWKIDEARFPRSYSIDFRPDPLILKVWQDKRGFITFVNQNLWTLIPELYKEVMGKEFQNG